MEKENKKLPIKPASVSQESWAKYMDVFNMAKELNDPFPAVTANQLALESGWFKKQSGSFNFGGQKARKNEDATEVVTHEDTDKGMIKITDRFKNYSSLKESLEDRAKRWFKVYKDAKNPQEAVEMLQKAGYATDKKYIDKMGNMFKTVNLDYSKDKSQLTDNSSIKENVKEPFNPTAIDNTFVSKQLQPEVKAPTIPNKPVNLNFSLTPQKKEQPEAKRNSAERVPTSTTPSQSVNPLDASYLTMLDKYVKTGNKKAEGGELTQFNTGGMHHQNPLGGIPQGLGSNGKINSVEEGETKYKFKDGEYIFSNRTKL